MKHTIYVLIAAILLAVGIFFFYPLVRATKEVKAAQILADYTHRLDQAANCHKREKDSLQILINFCDKEASKCDGDKIQKLMCQIDWLSRKQDFAIAQQDFRLLEIDSIKKVK